MLTKVLFIKVFCDYRKLRHNFAAIGRGCKIGRRTVIRGGERVQLGNNISLGRHSLLDAKTHGNGRIIIGDRTEIHDFSQLMCYGGEIVIEEDCSVNPFCILYGHGGLRIGSKVRIATHTIMVPAKHIFDRVDIPIMFQGESRKGIAIKDDVWIGSGAIILDGVTVGTGAVVAAGSVVTTDIPDYHVVAGVPAKTIRIRKA
jgi:acetyltransferase-like isoleucine patch superfamily enzyme